METNQILPINSNFEEKTNGFMYKCHFCKETIDGYNISNHFEKFHKFPSPEHICEFCETDKVVGFQTKNDLLKHIQSDHNLIEENPNQSEVKVKNLEEGKSKFLQFVNNFDSDKDAFSLLHWIKYNDTKKFLTKNKKFQKSFLDISDDNLRQEPFEDDQILVEDNLETAEFEEKNSADVNFTQEFVLHQNNSKPSKRIRDPIIYFFDGKSPSRYKH